MVIDDCWQEHHRLDEYNGGPWTKGNAKFPDMKGLADKLKEKVSTRPIRTHWHISEEISNGSATGDTL